MTDALKVMWRLRSGERVHIGTLDRHTERGGTIVYRFRYTKLGVDIALSTSLWPLQQFICNRHYRSKTLFATFAERIPRGARDMDPFVALTMFDWIDYIEMEAA